jgi:hypothetical protein
MTRDRTKVLGAWIFLLLLAVMGLSIGNAQNMRLEVERQFRSLPEEGEVGAYIKRLRRYLMTKAEARLPVDELLAEYETNRFAAEARYESTPKGTCARLYGLGKCQRVDVIAVVDDMGRDSDGHPYLSLRSAIAKGLRAEFTPDTEPAELADLRLGQTLMVRCEPVYDGRLRLINCLLAPDPASFEPSVESY